MDNMVINNRLKGKINVIIKKNLLLHTHMRTAKNKKAFTLIELLIVISIIGILSVSLLPSILSAPGAARDVIRKKALIEMQAALERYYDDRGEYPITTGTEWWAINAQYGSHTTSGSNGYIPNLAPDYIKELPLDPSGKKGSTSVGLCNDNTWSTYYYQSDGTYYKILNCCAYEGQYPVSGEQFYDGNRADWAISVCGGASGGCSL